MSTGWTQFRNDLKFLTLRVIVCLENDSILSNFEHKKINERFDVFFFFVIIAFANYLNL